MSQSQVVAKQVVGLRHSPKAWWSKLHWLAWLGVLVRIGMVLISDRIHHPDEILQYLEQAHRLEFGYGIIPWEYRHGIRSWLLPGLLAGLLSVFHHLHLDDPNLYIPTIKILFCLISISLIYATYIIVRTIASEPAARLASVLVCLWYETIHFASRPTPEVLATYCLTWAFACVVVAPSRRNTILFGLFCGLGIMLRFQYLPAIVVLAGWAIWRWRKGEVAIAASLVLALVGVTGYVDYVTWGSLFGSYYNNYVYNNVYQVSRFFGVEPFTDYFKSLTVNSAGIFLLAVIGALRPATLRKTWLLLLYIASIVLPHSLIAHKEHRFMLAAIPILLMLTAIVIADFIELEAGYPFGLKIGLRSRKMGLYAAMSLIACISIGGILVKVRWRDPIYQSQATIVRREPTLAAYLFLHRQADLVAILNAYQPWQSGDGFQWQRTGGYYYLHRNVPIYYLELSNEIINKDNYVNYVSHIICSPTDVTPGFITIAKFGDLEVRRIIQRPTNFIKPNIDFINLRQPEIDDVYQPRFPLK
jgi:GPI mannosyltransferase 3